MPIQLLGNKNNNLMVIDSHLIIFLIQALEFQNIKTKRVLNNFTENFSCNDDANFGEHFVYVIITLQKPTRQY